MQTNYKWFNSLPEFEDFVNGSSEFTFLNTEKENVYQLIQEGIEKKLNNIHENMKYPKEKLRTMMGLDKDSNGNNYVYKYFENLRKAHNENSLKRLNFLLWKSSTEGKNEYTGLFEISTRSPDNDVITVDFINFENRLQGNQMLKRVMIEVSTRFIDVNSLEILAFFFDDKSIEEDSTDLLLDNGFKIVQDKSIKSISFKLDDDKNTHKIKLDIWSRQLNFVQKLNEDLKNKIMYRLIDSAVTALTINKNENSIEGFKERRFGFWRKRKNRLFFPYFWWYYPFWFQNFIQQLESPELIEMKKEIQKVKYAEYEDENSIIKLCQLRDQSIISISFKIKNDSYIKLDNSLINEYKQYVDNSISDIKVESFELNATTTENKNKIKNFFLFKDGDNKSLCNHYLEIKAFRDWIEFKNRTENICFACEFKNQFKK